MIISKQNGQIYMIRQDEHMIQSGFMATRWGNAEMARPETDASVELAVSQHDIGWGKPDDEILFNSETGLPFNFTHVNIRQHLEFYGNGYREILKQDPYAGLLIGMHWLGLYRSRYGYDPSLVIKISEDLVPLLKKTIADREKEWIDIKLERWNGKESRREFEDRIWMHYEWLQLLDRISLFICMNDLNEVKQTTLGKFRCSLNEGYQSLNIKSTGNGEISFDRFPFDSEFDLSVPVRCIPDRRYSSQEELREAYFAATLKQLTCRIIAS
jgi:hypothetical protein